MLKTEQRLRRQRDIDAVYLSGRKGYTNFIRIVFLQSKRPESRFAVVVSNKVSKLATDRNLIKRRVRSTISELLPRFVRAYDIIIIVQPKSLTASHEQLFKTIDDFFTKNKLYGA